MLMWEMDSVRIRFSLSLLMHKMRRCIDNSKMLGLRRTADFLGGVNCLRLLFEIKLAQYHMRHQDNIYFVCFADRRNKVKRNE